MKKIFFILLVLFTLTSCNLLCHHEWIESTDGAGYVCSLCGVPQRTSDPYAKPISYDEWKEISDKSNYDNYTLKVIYSPKFIAVGQPYSQVTLYKITEDNVSVVITPGSDSTDERILNSEAAYIEKEFFSLLFSKLLDNYNLFKYDRANNEYSSDEEINLQFLIETSEGNLYYYVTMKNVVFKISSSRKLTKINCEYKQRIRNVVNDEEIFEGKIELNLSNYESTTIENIPQSRKINYYDLTIDIPKGFIFEQDSSIIYAVSPNHPIEGDNIVIYLTSDYSEEEITKEYLDQYYKDLLGDSFTIETYEQTMIDSYKAIKVKASSTFEGVKMTQIQAYIFKEDIIYMVVFTLVNEKYMSEFMSSFNSITLSELLSIISFNS